MKCKGEAVKKPENFAEDVHGWSHLGRDIRRGLRLTGEAARGRGGCRRGHEHRRPVQGGDSIDATFL